MNRNLVGILIALAASSATGVPNTYAQTLVPATVPFAFTVGQNEMPAGTYTISSMSQSVILIRDRNTGKSLLTLSCPEHGGSSNGTPKLVFNKYGYKYFLSRVSHRFGSAIMQLPTSKLEKEMQFARSEGVSEQEVVVAAK